MYVLKGFIADVVYSKGLYNYCMKTFLTYRGKLSFDQSGVGTEAPGEVSKEDDMFDVYRKRMMLAYRFRPNPLVHRTLYINTLTWHFTCPCLSGM